VSSYGTYQTIYEKDQLSDHSAFEVSVIGSLQLFLMVFMGFLTGPIFDMGYFRHMLAVGSVFIVLGTMLQSICSHYWHFILAQGVVVGLGTGCLCIPTVAITAQWFSTRLPIANGVAASGSGFGGSVPTSYDDAREVH
jgi:MFS family permease